jgi:hypothetical protein
MSSKTQRVGRKFTFLGRRRFMPTTSGSDLHRRTPLTLEALEDRTLPSVTIWTGANTLHDDNWSDPANWSNGKPGPADTAEFNSDSAATQFSTVDTGFTIASLLLTPKAGGDMTINAPLVLTGNSEWEAVKLVVDGSRGGSVTNNGTITENGGGGALAGSGAFTNNGTIFLVGDGLNIAGSSNDPSNPQATLDNSSTGVIDMQSAGGILQNGFGFPRFTNEGTIEKTGGTGTSVMNMPLTNTGVIDAESGTISLASAGAVDSNGTFKTGTSDVIELANDSAFTENGTFTATGSGTILLDKGKLDSGSAGSTFDIAGSVTFSWNNASIDVPAMTTLTYNGSLSINGSGFASLFGGGTFLENGTITVSATGSLAGLAINDGASTDSTLDIASGSTLDFQSDAGIFVNCCGEGQELLANAGTIEKTGGTGTSTISVPITNNGAVVVDTGNLKVHAGVQGFTNSESLTVDASSSFQIDGNYTQTAMGSLHPLLAGPSSFGQLQVSGQVTLAGGLNVSAANNFAPTTAETFPVLTAGSLSGTFSSLSGLSFANGIVLNPVYSSTGVVLSPAQAPPSQVHFTVAASNVSRTGAHTVLTVARTGSISQTVTLHYATADGTAHAGTDYTGASGTLTFNPGDLAVTLPITIQNDGQANGDEAFTVTLSNPTGGATVDSPGVSSVTINDPLPVEALPSNLTTMATTLTHSNESYGTFVRRAYELYLHRDTDTAGLNFWVGLMRNGYRDESLEAAILGSPEYITVHGGTGSKWVTGMYEDLLGRAPDSAGLSFWVNALAHGSHASDVAFGFAASKERESLRISSDYLVYLGRPLDQGGQTFWVNAFLNGAHNEDVVAGFIASAEYYTSTSKGQSDRAAWVKSVFEDVIQRAASQTDVAIWKSLMR